MVELDEGKAVWEQPHLYPKVSCPGGRACSKALVRTQGAAAAVELEDGDGELEPFDEDRVYIRVTQEAQHSRCYSWGGKVYVVASATVDRGTPMRASLSVATMNSGAVARGHGMVAGLFFREDAHST